MRKQDRNDFNSRIKRLDPAYADLPQEARTDRKPWEMTAKVGFRAESPILMMMLSFVLALLAYFAASDPLAVRSLLLDWAWPVQFLDYGMLGIFILIAGLALFYIGCLLRIVNPRATGRWNAGGLIAGAVAALTVANLDPDMVDAGFQMAGLQGPNDLLTYAQARGADFANIDWASVVMVSSSLK